jgi:hypothetical protein
MRTARLAVAPVVVAVVLGMAACDKGGGEATPPPTTDGNIVGGSPGKAVPGTPVKLDLCEVVTLERAKQLVGDGAAAGDSSATECSYSDDATGHSVNLKLEDDPDGTQFGAERRIGGPADKVTGVGDDAFYHQSTHTLYVRKGGTNLTVQIVTDPDRQDAVLDDEKKLAAEVVGSAA